MLKTARARFIWKVLFFSISYLAVPKPTLGHCLRRRQSYSMFMFHFTCLISPEGYWGLCNKVEFQDLVKPIRGIQAENLRLSLNLQTSPCNLQVPHLILGKRDGMTCCEKLAITQYDIFHCILFPYANRFL